MSENDYSSSRKLVEDMVRESGNEVLMDTLKCILWQNGHKNCKGCPSELGCNKFVRIRLLFLTTLTYWPSSFEDFQKMSNRIDELVKMNLNAKTIEELNKVPEI